MSWSYADFVAGWAGGVAGLLVGHPADTVKVRQQTFPESSGALRTLKITIRYEGIRGLYKGLSFPLMTAGTLNAIFFGAYGNVLRVCDEYQHARIFHTSAICPLPEQRPSYFEIYLAGSTAGMVATVFACPVDIIKIQMQAQTARAAEEWKTHPAPKYAGPVDCLTHIFRNVGPRALYRGFFPMLARDTSSYGLYMTLYEWILRSTAMSKDDHAMIMLSGGVAGVMSWIVITPLDLIKSRMQADDLENPQFKSAWECARVTYQQGGPKMFFRGFFMMVIRSFPVNAATFVVYEQCLKWLQKGQTYAAIRREKKT